MYPRKSSAILLVLLLASSAWAEPPKLAITGPTNVIPGSAVFLQLETDAVAVDWIVFPPSAQGNFVPLTLYQGMTPDGKPILKYAAFFSSPTPGTYTFAAVGCKQDQLGKAVHTLVNGTPNPNPNPEPEPNPNPQPPPTPGKRFVLVLAESSTRTAEQAVAINGLTSYLTSKKHQWRVSDPDLKDSKTGKTPTWLASYLAKVQAAKVPLPALIVSAPSTASSDDGNTVLAIVPLPPTATEAIAVVNKFGG